jgi:hypothetical protein
VRALDDSDTCNGDVVQAIDGARSTLEGLSAVSLNLAAFDAMTVPEQLFVIANIERVDRGITPLVGLTTQLDTVAQQGATADTDPLLSVADLTGGATVIGWGSNWAGGTTNPLGSDYYWMYDDGVGGVNGDCTSAGDPGCWGHRDLILGAFGTASSCPSGLGQYMGAGFTSSGSYGPSFGEIFVGGCGATPSDVVFTWIQAQALLDPDPVRVPGAPLRLRVSPAKTSVVLAWDAPSADGGAPVTGYEVLRGRSSGKETDRITVACTSSSCSYRDKQVKPRVTYSYEVAALNSAGAGPPSNEVTARIR